MGFVLRDLPLEGHEVLTYCEVPGALGVPGAPGAPGAAGAPGAPGMPGMVGAVGSSAPHEAQTVALASLVAPHFSHFLSRLTAAGLKHMAIPFCRVF